MTAGAGAWEPAGRPGSGERSHRLAPQECVNPEHDEFAIWAAELETEQPLGPICAKCGRTSAGPGRILCPGCKEVISRQAGMN
jgi:hypothetical protein